MKKAFLPTLLSVFMLMLLFSAAPVSAATTTEYSSNWSGYVATTSRSDPFTLVSATWTVPTVETTPSPAYSSVWVGIGGWYRNGSKLIQAGTEQDVDSDGSPTYSAWYEVYPQKFPVPIGDVEPGDTISVSISKISEKPEYWNITVTDNGNPLLNENVKLKPNFASQATAEFIVERPLLIRGHQLAPLADFGTVTFSNCTTNLDGLGSLDNIVQVNMTSDGSSTGTLLASPGDLSGNGFTIKYGP
jgi:hypothetical protein